MEANLLISLMYDQMYFNVWINIFEPHLEVLMFTMLKLQPNYLIELVSLMHSYGHFGEVKNLFLYQIPLNFGLCLRLQ